MLKHIGRQSVRFLKPVRVASSAAVGGKTEGLGPLRERFDALSEDSYFGMDSWEAAETELLRRCFRILCEKGKVTDAELRYVLSGDLQNQCTGSAYLARELAASYLGLYSACATMGEGLGLGALLAAGGAEPVCVMTSSHFCAAERQFRTPLEYGAQRCPTAQWTATAAGAVLLRTGGGGPAITCATTGRVLDAGVTDLSNMGAAMAPAALDTLLAHTRDSGREPAAYDAVITGDLGRFGHEILADLARREGLAMPAVFTDCGMLLYDPEHQDVHSGGSGAGCSASVFAGHIVKCVEEGMWASVLFLPTGALMSPVTVQQGESIPAVCHAVALERREGED